MRRFTLLLLVVAPICLAADWVVLGSNEVLTVYASTESKKRVADTVKMWRLINFSKDRKSTYKYFRSARGLQEYDCTNDRVRTLYSSLHADPMGAGEMIESREEEGKWEIIPPDSAHELLFKAACK